MIDVIVGFVALLRGHGIEVGADRSALAARALQFVDLSDRSATKRTLRLTLVMHGADEVHFDELFDRWFAGSPLVDEIGSDVLPAGTADGESGQPAVEIDAATAPDAYVDDPSEQIAVSSDGGDPDRRRVHGDTPESSDGDVAARFDAAAQVGRIDPTDRSGPAERTDGSAAAEETLIELASDVDGDPDDVASIRSAMDEARRARLALLAPNRPSAPPTLRPNSVLANPFDRDEQRALDDAVRTLWPQLAGSPAWRRRSAPIGDLDVRRTLRSSVALGGVPAAVRHRAPATTRPELLVLVDTSVSMRPFSRLMLHLAHALRRRPGRVRVLGFVDEFVDVTDVIRHADLAAALGGLLDDAPGGPLDPARSSDYGAAFASLWHRYARLLRPSTTVLVLGDGRSNGRDPGFAHVDAVTTRCRRTLWCTPEPEGAWGFGNAEMGQYARRVNVAATIRSLDDLRDVVRSGVFRSDSGSDTMIRSATSCGSAHSGSSLALPSPAASERQSAGWRPSWPRIEV